MPKRSLIWIPLLLGSSSLPAQAQSLFRITEYMYKGGDGEFFELTNVSGMSLSLAGWSMDDDSAAAGTLDLSPLGMIPAGGSAIVCQAPEDVFLTAWGLTGSGVPVLGSQTLAPLGRNDTIHLFNPISSLHDVLTYGDELFLGTFRTDSVSASVCDEAIGLNRIYSWEESEIGDLRGSVMSGLGDIGNPGSYTPLSCNHYAYCTPALPNSTGDPGRIIAMTNRVAADNDLILVAQDLPTNQFGYFLVAANQGLINSPVGSMGDLCLALPIGRFASQLQNSGVLGAFQIQVDLTILPTTPMVAVVAGDTWNFQGWYRDMNPGPTSNFTDAVSLTFR